MAKVVRCDNCETIFNPITDYNSLKYIQECSHCGCDMQRV